MRITVLPLVLVFVLSCHLSAEPPRWSVRVHPVVLAGLDYADLERGRISPEELVQKLKAPDFGNQVGTFLDLARRHGISTVVVDGIQPEMKGIYFRSEELERLGWVVLANVLQVVKAEAAQRNLQLGVNLSDLGIHARGLYDQEFGLDQVKKLSVAGLEPLCQGLFRAYALASLEEEEFPAAWFDPLVKLRQSLGFRYIHRASADDIVSLTSGGQRTTPLEAFPSSLTLSTSDAFPMLAPGTESAATNGSLPLMLQSEGCAIEVSDRYRGRLFMEGALLFRALQAAPGEITLNASRETLGRMSPALTQRAAELIGQHDSAAPVLDLVVLGKPKARLDAGYVAWLQLAANLEPLSLAFGAAGFRVKMTSRVQPDARAYYVYLAGDALQDWNDCQSALQALDRETPVFVQLGSEPQQDVQDALSRFLGFRSTAWVKGIVPPVGLYRGRQVNVKGPDLYGGNIPGGYLQMTVDGPQILMADLSRTPLVVASPRFPSRFFVNSNLIHRDMAFPISHLLASGRGLQRPAACFIAVGKKTAFWALADTEVEWVHPRTGARLVLEMKEGGFHVE
ncbi:MAG: hypothetical protein EHM61_05700 [Acidobacteria bacterium]|nr:MAG: hypothetical protein EHM61_05700 [Acidobacteriota bacterium]